MQSEFTDEYDDWLSGAKERAGSGLFDLPITALEHRKPISVEPGASIRTAIETMERLHTGCVLVEEDGRMVGIFTERDAVRRVGRGEMDLSTTPVSEVMTTEPKTMGAGVTLANVLRTMCEHHHRHMPILDAEDRAICVVSMRRIVQYLVDAYPHEILNSPPEGQLPPTTPEGG